MNSTRVARSAVKAYYDSATRLFLALGHGGRSRLIHRAVWGPGVRRREEAMHYVHELILREINATAAERFLDLGCGAGGSLLYLIKRTGGFGVGVTISRTQARMAKDLLSRVFSHNRFRIYEGDMTNIDGIVSDHYRSVAYAIESFVHLTHPDRFFAALSNVLRPMDRLIIIDDLLLRQPRGRLDSWLVRRFSRGWNVQSLRHIEEIAKKAVRFGFVLDDDTDLSGYLELDRPRDLLLRGLSPLLSLAVGRTAWVRSMDGGDALQRCLKRRLVGYRYLRFIRV